MSSAKKLLQSFGQDGLKCTVPGCKVKIWAMTGLQEIQKLQRHMAKAHAARWDMNTALENRIIMEKKNERIS